MLLLLSLLLHCLVVDVAALQFVGPSTLVLSLTSNNFWLNFIFLLFSIFCLQQFLCIHPPPDILPTVSVEVWRTLLLGIPYFYTWNATKVARYVYCYKWFSFLCKHLMHNDLGSLIKNRCPPNSWLQVSDEMLLREEEKTKLWSWLKSASRDSPKFSTEILQLHGYNIRY